MFDLTERTKMNTLSGVGRSSEMSSQQNGQNGRWMQKPTRIEPPRNQPRSESHGYASSPYNTAAMGSRHSKELRGNASARATLVHELRPNKRQKTTHPTNSALYVKGRGTASDPSDSAHKPIKPQSSVINLDADDEDEDIGVVVPSTSNRLDHFDGSASQKPHGKRSYLVAPEEPELEIDLDKDNFRSGFHTPVRDGVDTLALEDRFGHHSENDDPITEFTPSPVRVEQPHAGFVKESVKKFEKISVDSTDRNFIDLRDHTATGRTKSALKGNMKPKNHRAGAIRDPEATTPTGFKNPSTGTYPGGELWVTEWFLGIERRSGVSGCFIKWDDYRLYVKDIKGGKNLLTLSPKDDIRNVEYTETGNFVILALGTVRLENAGHNTEHFTMGDGQRGNVIFKFDNGCKDKIYASLIQWMRKHQVSCSALRGTSASQAKWDVAKRKSELEDVVHKRMSNEATRAQFFRKTSRTLKQLASDSEDGAPPPVEKLSASSRSASRTAEGRDIAVADPVTPLRRSARGQSASKPRQTPVQDPDEVILCYPQGVTGAVNITNGDYKRLEPGEFLNDTLIEYGLKRWLKKVEETNQELAAQIHVFSSFFYKKLNKKDQNEGYNSVRKWTAKIDIFNKKYIIVPINENLHWYLAIIYHPEHTLNPNPSPVKSPVTRAKKNSPILPKSLKKPALTNLSTANPLHIEPTSSRPSLSPIPVSSEGEVEAVVLEAFCSITMEPLDSPKLHAISAPSHDPDSMIIASGSSPTAMDVEPRTFTFREEHSSRTYQDENFDSEGTFAGDYANSLFGDNDNDSHDISSGHVEPQRFYGKPSKVALGKRKAIPDQALSSQDDSLVVDDDDATPSSESATYIFTFDSLGTRHPQAIRHLKNYLKKEAEDKLGKTETRDAIGKQAHVPVQPNFCDCGLFLLHFAETFISDPDKYFQMITARASKATRPTLQDDWKSELTSGMRERLRSDIDQLSLEWKKDKGEKEHDLAGIQTIESSDDEIDIVKEVPALSTTTKDGKVKTEKPMRHRG